MKKSEVLKLAKPHIEETEYICFAINRTKTSDTARLSARHYVARLLGQWGTAKTWLSQEAKIPRRKLTPKNMLLYRQRWLDHMVAELEKEGK
jgi:hypothetical protein